MPNLISKKDQLNFSPATCEKMPKAQKVLMISPAYFDIDAAINAHMKDSAGNLHKLDKAKAHTQWEELKKTYTSLGFNVFVCEGVPELVDMVFSANQCFPFVDKLGKRFHVTSNMADNRRHKEVPFVSAALQKHNSTALSLGEREKSSYFESMGDALWLPGKRFILGGYGFRTDKKVYEKLSSLTDAPIALFELLNPKFYHLDTCLSILDEKSALVCREAFTPEGFALLQEIFPQLIEVPLAEADSPYFACNAHCPDEKHVILQKGCQETENKLRAQGFIPLPVDTSEFIKSGGSVFCMKLMFF